MSCQYHHSDLYCDITLCLAIKMDSHLGAILGLCEIKLGDVGKTTINVRQQ